MNRSQCGFSKIWIIIIILAFCVGGFLIWRYFGASKEAVKMFQGKDYEIKYLASNQPATQTRNILIYSNLTIQLENPDAPESISNRPIKLVLEIFKKNLDSGDIQKIIEIKQNERPAHRGIFAEKRGNYIVVFGLGQTAREEKIFDLSGNLLQNFEFPPNFDSLSPLVFAENNELYAYTILHNYSNEDTGTIKEEEWGTVVVKNQQGREMIKLSMAEFKEITNTEHLFNELNKYYLPESNYLSPVGFRDSQNLYLSLQPDFHGPVPGYLFVLNLKTKEIKEITNIREKELVKNLEYTLNPQIGLAYGMKQEQIGLEGELGNPPTELFLIDLDKDEYKIIVKEEELLAGSCIIDKNGQYLAFNFTQPVFAKESSEVKLYNLKTKEITSLGKLDDNVFIKAILNNGASLVYTDNDGELYLFNVLTKENKQVFDKKYQYIGIWE